MRARMHSQRMTRMSMSLIRLQWTRLNWSSTSSSASSVSLSSGPSNLNHWVPPAFVQNRLIHSRPTQQSLSASTSAHSSSKSSSPSSDPLNSTSRFGLIAISLTLLSGVVICCDQDADAFELRYHETMKMIINEIREDPKLSAVDALRQFIASYLRSPIRDSQLQQTSISTPTASAMSASTLTVPSHSTNITHAFNGVVGTLTRNIDGSTVSIRYSRLPTRHRDSFQATVDIIDSTGAKLTTHVEFQTPLFFSSSPIRYLDDCSMEITSVTRNRNTMPFSSLSSEEQSILSTVLHRHGINPWLGSFVAAVFSYKRAAGLDSFSVAPMASSQGAIGPRAPMIGNLPSAKNSSTSLEDLKKWTRI